MRRWPVVALVVLAVASPVVLHAGFQGSDVAGSSIGPPLGGETRDVADSSGPTPGAATAVEPAPRASVERDRRPDPGDRTCPSAAARDDRETGGAASNPDDPRIVELYPNPTAEGNVGEYAVLAFPEPTALGDWTLTDGHATAGFPNETVDGRVAVTMAPEETRPLTDAPVAALDGHLRLAADGDALRLREGNRTVDAVAYERAPLAERWYRTGPAETDGAWWPRGATCLPPERTSVDEATAFVLPDAPDVPLETIRSADERLLLAGYTFTSDAVASELRAAAERGVDVRVLVEGGPVGGAPAGTAAVLDDLAAAGVEVRVVGGEGARYRYHHAKYAVADDRVLVLTENWKPAGVGGASSRGWGAVVEDPDLAATLAGVFESDFAGRDTAAWGRYARTASFVEADPATGAYPARIEAETVPVESAEVLVAPDNAEPRLRELLRNADESILITQVRVGGPSFSLLEAAVAAAERGVEVRILLDSTWYVEEENRALAARLSERAAEEDLPLEVRLAEPGSRFEKIHAKGVVIDGEAVVVGSANWNDAAMTDNREVVLVLHGEAVGSYYAAVFEADWSDETRPFPVGLLAAVLAALVAAWVVGRRRVTIEPARDDECRAERGDRPT